MSCIGFIGPVGVGKSFTINALLSLFQSQGNETKRSVTEEEEETVPLSQLASILANGEFKNVTTTVTDDKDAIFYENEVKKDHLNVTTIANDPYFSDTMYEGFPPFLLPTAATYSHTSTTTYVTEIVGGGGDKYVLEVTYMTKEEIAEQLLAYDFVIGAQLAREASYSSGHREKYDKMVEWMKTLVQKTDRLARATKKAKLELIELAEIEAEFGHELEDYIPMSPHIPAEAYHRTFRERVVFNDFVSKLSGRTLRFEGSRKFIRCALYGVTIRGLAHEFRHAANCTAQYVSPGCEAEPSGDTRMIAKVRVIVPGLPPGTKWLDLPGVGDTCPIKSEQLKKGIAECTSFVVLSDRLYSSSRSLANDLERFVFPRTVKEWTYGTPVKSIAYFLCDKGADMRYRMNEANHHEELMKNIQTYAQFPFGTKLPTSLIQTYYPEQALETASNTGELLPRVKNVLEKGIKRKHLESLFADCGRTLAPLTYMRAKLRGERINESVNGMAQLIAKLRTEAGGAAATAETEPIRLPNKPMYAEVLSKQITAMETRWRDSNCSMVTIVGDVMDGRVARMFTDWLRFKLLSGGVLDEPRVREMERALATRLRFNVAQRLSKLDKEKEIDRLVKGMRTFLESL